MPASPEIHVTAEGLFLAPNDGKLVQAISIRPTDGRLQTTVTLSGPPDTLEKQVLEFKFFLPPQTVQASRPTSVELVYADQPFKVLIHLRANDLLSQEGFDQVYLGLKTLRNLQPVPLQTIAPIPAKTSEPAPTRSRRMPGYACLYRVIRTINHLLNL